MAKKQASEKMIMRVIRVAEILQQAQSCHDQQPTERETVMEQDYNAKNKTRT